MAATKNPPSFVDHVNSHTSTQAVRQETDDGGVMFAAAPTNLDSLSCYCGGSTILRGGYLQTSAPKVSTWLDMRSTMTVIWLN